MLPIREALNCHNETKEGITFHAEEEQSGTDRVGMGNHR